MLGKVCCTPFIQSGVARRRLCSRSSNTSCLWWLGFVSHQRLIGFNFVERCRSAIIVPRLQERPLHQFCYWITVLDVAILWLFYVVTFYDCPNLYWSIIKWDCQVKGKPKIRNENCQGFYRKVAEGRVKPHGTTIRCKK